MKTSDVDSFATLQGLRARAEAQLQRPAAPSTAGTPTDEVCRLLLELETQQLELEMQNEELLAAQLTTAQTRDEYAGLYEQALMAYVTLSAHGLIERANQRASQLFGTAATHLEGRRFLLFVAPDSRAAGAAWLARLQAGEAPPAIELGLLTEAGNTRMAQVEGVAEAPDSYGRPCRLALLDVGERHRAIASMSASEKRTRLALAATGAGVIEWDCATNLIFLDERARTLVGLPGPAAKLTLPQLQARVLPDDLQLVGNALNRAAAGEALALEFRMLDAAGQPRYLSVHCEVVFEAAQRLRLTGLLMDVTERRQAREEAARLRLNQQRAIFDAVLATQEKERHRMAQTLHNGVGQLLYLMKLRLENQAGPPADLLYLLDKAIRDVRAVSADLAPPVLEDFGLKSALESLAKRVPPGHLRVHCNFQGLAAGLLRPLQTTVYRMVQELLNNVLKHAQAEEVFLHVVHENGQVAINVDDDGKGIDPEAPEKEPPGIGLSSIRSQVSQLGGVINVTSGPGRGTAVSIDLPVPNLNRPLAT